ncbi:ABC transporter permease [Virgibacillus kekensis]|uniref:ABC transporter permease n=1 Tax=Virgibacillus kekensis TaxID=202261 RepID=A0ABV9DFN7_9BACI
MTFLRNLTLFTLNNFKHLQRKWLSLPLLLLFPVVLVFLAAFVAVTIFMPEDRNPVHVGLVDMDKSKETKMVVDMIEETSQIGTYIKIDTLTEEQAKRAINNRLSAYVTFPEGFTKSLYEGNPVKLRIIGNPDKSTESYIVKELIDSIARHIRTSQANILTINNYLKQLPVSDKMRQEILLKQFSSFVFYTVGKDKIIEEEEVTNHATQSPTKYYSLAAWFTVLTLWLLIMYSFLTRDEEPRIKRRMRLYGVTDFQLLSAKILTTFLIVFVCSMIACTLLIKLMSFSITADDYLRMTGITLLHCCIYLLGLAVLEMLLSDQKVRLLVQSIFTFLTLLLSGAVIPTLYFPLYIQELLPYSFGSEAFNWLQEIVLNGRIYTNFIPLILMTVSFFLLFLGISKWKEHAV